MYRLHNNGSVKFSIHRPWSHSLIGKTAVSKTADLGSIPSDFVVSALS